MKAIRKYEDGGKRADRKEWRKGRKKESRQMRDERHAMKQLRWELANNKASEGGEDVSELSSKELAERFRKKRAANLKTGLGSVLGAGAAAFAASAVGTRGWRKK